MENDAVIVDVVILSTTFSKAINYFLTISVSKPEPAFQPLDPGSKRGHREGKLTEDVRQTFRTDIIQESSREEFSKPKFTFTLNATRVQSGAETRTCIIGGINFEVFAVSPVLNSETLVGQTFQTITPLISNLLLEGELVPLTLRFESDELNGEVRVEMKLSSDISSLIAAKQTSHPMKNSKISQLLHQLRESSEVHLKILEETNRMKDSKLFNHLEELGEDMKQKRIVIEQFMSEMHTKNEQIETYKKKYQEQVQVIQQYEKDVNELRNQMEDYRKGVQLAKKGDTLYAKYIEQQALLADAEELKATHQKLVTAHEEQNIFIQKLHKRLRTLKKYKLVSQKQETVIKKLELLLEQTINSNYQLSISRSKRSSRGDIQLEKLRQDKQVIHNELDEIKKEKKELTVELQVAKQEQEAKANKIKQLQEELIEDNSKRTQYIGDPGDSHEWVRRNQELETRLQERQERIKRLEDEKNLLLKRAMVAEEKARRIEEGSVRFARENAILKMKAAEKSLFEFTNENNSNSNEQGKH